MDHIRKYLADHGVIADHLRTLTDEPRPTYLFDVPGVDAENAWASLHAAADAVGFTPIILGEPDEVIMLMECLDLTPEPPDEIIEASLKVDVNRWLTDRRVLDPEAYAIAPAAWPDDVTPHNGLTAIMDSATDKPHDRVVMALVPSPSSWMAAAYLRFGGFNDCPQPFEHVAVWRQWNRTYGAEIIAITHDVIEARVARPPTTRKAALALAHEQFTYCSDIVTQGTESVEMTAACLLNAPMWFFWWD